MNGTNTMVGLSVMYKCPRGDYEIKNQETVFCPQSGQQFAFGSISEAKKDRTGFPIAAGILMITAGCLLAFYGIIGVLASWANLHSSDFYPSLVMGVSGLIGSFLSLGGGIATLKRRSWALPLVSIVLALIAELVHLITYGLMSPHGNIVAGLFVTLPVIAISLLALILVALSKAQFLDSPL